MKLHCMLRGTKPNDGELAECMGAKRAMSLDEKPHQADVGMSRSMGKWTITQFLTGHRYFQSYLKNVGKVESQECLYCPEASDNDSDSFIFDR